MIGKLQRRYVRHCKERHLRGHSSLLIVGANLVLLSVLILDQPVSVYVLNMHSVLKTFGATVTDFGKSGWILFACAVLLMEALAMARLAGSGTARFRALFVGHLAAYLLSSVAISGICANIAKRMIGRARPIYQDEWGVFGFSPFHGSFQFESFPSGHSTTVGTIMMAVALIAPRYRVLCLVLAIWLGISRVLVGAHYPSDVIAGLVFGAWSSIILAGVFARFGILFRENGEGLPVLRRYLPFAILANGLWTPQELPTRRAESRSEPSTVGPLVSEPA